MKSRKQSSSEVRYAVVGLGYIAQVAVLPAFAHARKNSVLAALISDDPAKLHALSKKYKVRQTCSYDEYDKLLRSGDVDAVYIALPNSLHCEYAVRAARAGLHILCEKPLAVTEPECQKMIDAAAEHDVKLMTAYRLHFDEANLRAMHVVQTGQLGEPRIFDSVFSMQVKDDDIRVQAALGGGTLYDIGIYCINAARYLFGAEPEQVLALSVKGTEPRFTEVDEMTSAVLRFPGDRIASFTTSFGAAENSWFEVVGTKGSLFMSNAYEYARKRDQFVWNNGKTTKRTYKPHDQFAPELIYFSACILNDRNPEPSGEEGLIDVKIIRALYESARTGRAIQLEGDQKQERPSLQQRILRPKVKEPELVHSSPPSKD